MVSAKLEYIDFVGENYLVKISTSSKVEILYSDKEIYKVIKEYMGDTPERVRPRGLGKEFAMYVNGDGVNLNLPVNIVGTMLYNRSGIGEPIREVSHYIYGDLYICENILKELENVDSYMDVASIENLLDIIYEKKNV